MRPLKILTKIRDWVRRWLGLDELPTKNMLAAIEAANRERQKVLVAMLSDIANDSRKEQEKRHAQIMASFTEMNTRLSASHVDHPANFAAPILDWDTVQAIVAHNLENETMPESLKEIYR